MFFSKDITYKNSITLDELFMKISSAISYDIAYWVKKENKQIVMKPINNLVMYNSFKPSIRIFCDQESIKVRISLTKSTKFALYFAMVFVLFLDFITVFMKLYQMPDWPLSLLISQIIIGLMILGAKLSFEYFYKKIKNWFTEI